MSKFITIPIYIYSLISAQGLAENIVSIIFSVNSDLQVCIYLILSKVILYFVSRFMLKYSIKAQYKVPKAYWMFMIFVLAINQSYILLMNAVSSGVFSKNLMIALQLAIFALNLLLYFLFEKIIENYEEKLKYSLINQQLYLQKQSLEEMEKANQTIKNFKHDIKNHIMCIELMLKDKDYNEINRYLSGLSQSMSTSYSFVKSGNKIVDAVLNSKLTYARARQIQMNIEANLSIEIGIEDFELCALLSNLVDNALEASEKVNEPEINIMIKIVKKYLVISITNRLSDNFVINPNFVTTKKDKENHGIGMSVIKSIVSHYEGNVSFSVENGLFNARVFLLNKIPGS
jgi:sensor histidine kinase YesM